MLALSACSPGMAASPSSGPRPVDTTLEVPRLDGGATANGPENSGTGVRFGRVPPTPGAKWAVTVEARSEANHADPLGGPTAMSAQLSEYISEYNVEILATNGPAPSRVRLVFEKNIQRYQGVDKATVIDGKSFIVEAAAPHVRDNATGNAASEEETQRVLDVFPDLGTRTQIDQVLPDIAMAIGEERHELAQAILRVIHPRAWTMNRGSAVLARVDGDAAVFAIAVDATGQSGLRMDVKGEARIRIRDARLASIALEGTYDHPKGSVAPGDPSEPGHFVLRRIVRDVVLAGAAGAPAASTSAHP
jgi:hypothetical protein